MSAHPVEMLSALLDDELEEAQRREVETHLASCPSCAQHWRELTALDALARGLPPAKAPDGYLDTLPGRVRQRIGADRPRRAVAPWMLPLAAGLALAVLAPLVWRERASTIPTAEEARSAQAEIPPAVTVPPRGVRGEAAPATASRDFATEKDARPLERARQEAPRRAAPAAGTVAPAAPQSTDSLADAPSAKAMVLREEERADAAAAASEPAFAPPPAAEAESKQAEAQVATSGRLAGAASGGAGPSALRKSERGNAAVESAEERAFRAIATRPLSTATEARGVREDWLRFVAEHPRGARLDEARVRLVEASVAAFRDGADPADRIAAERDAAAYLSSPNASQAARVRAALRRLDDRP
jgi:hypothetical protein